MENTHDTWLFLEAKKKRKTGIADAPYLKFAAAIESRSEKNSATKRKTRSPVKKYINNL